MICRVVVEEEDEEEDEEEQEKMKTTIKMHKTFYAMEMSRDAKWHTEWRVPTNCLTDKQTD